MQRDLRSDVGELSASARLRRETREEHTSVEATPFAVALVGGRLTRLAYGRQLAAYARLHESLERTFDAIPRLRNRLPARRSVLARADLLVLGGSHEPDAAIEEPLRRFEAATSPAQALPIILGHAYVMEGSALGSLSLAQRVQSALALPEGATQYYRGLGASTASAWGAFRAFLDATIGPTDVDTAVTSARLAFATMRSVLLGLGEPIET